jgi:hypothetical protein
MIKDYLSHFIFFSNLPLYQDSDSESGSPKSLNPYPHDNAQKQFLNINYSVTFFGDHSALCYIARSNVHLRISLRIRNHIQKWFNLFISGPSRIDWWKNTLGLKILCDCPFKPVPAHISLYGVRACIHCKNGGNKHYFKVDIWTVLRHHIIFMRFQLRVEN